MLANRTQEQTNLENFETCRRIGEELDAIASGMMYRCPECGEIVKIEDEEDEDGRIKCPECGKLIDSDELEPYSMYDYFEDALDIEYRIGSDREYRSVQVMVAWGGPNIYVDTDSKRVELYWWTDRASYRMSDEAVEAVDECFQELFNM